jgi:hypothetical protein
MKKAIIVSQNDQAANMITHALKSTGYLNISRFSAVCEARRYIMSILADIIIIESPFNDDGADFAIFAASRRVQTPSSDNSLSILISILPNQNKNCGVKNR